VQTSLVVNWSMGPHTDGEAFVQHGPKPANLAHLRARYFMGSE
jgi:hypothetical protein